MNAERKFQLITRNLQEVIGENEIKEILKERDLKVYWGTAPTGRLHVGYLVPLNKIVDLLNANCDVIILFADLHAYLDNMKTNWELLGRRTEYYEVLIKEIIKIIGGNITKLKFVRGTDIELTKEYMLDMYKLSSLVSERDAKKAGAEVVKQVESPKIGGLLYPILQTLDEEYLGVDVQFGGIDQRKIFVFARENLPRIGYKKRAHLMNVMIQGLNGDKMSSSDVTSKIDILDSEKEIRSKMNKVICPEGEIENNNLFPLIKYIIFPILERNENNFVIKRLEKYGGNITIKNYDELETKYINKEIHPMDLKNGVSDFFVELMEPIRKHFEQKEMQELIKEAYPE